MDIDQKNLFRLQLLAWYDKYARILPWRETHDPYAIWVSEIMLQQTQVNTVIAYYKRWMHKFPTVETLAKARADDVMKYWAGLGYYRRARMLHEGAKMIISQYNGRVPDTVEELIRLPGIGRYTAGAIASIAFGKKAPLLDGNVIRILTRLFGIKRDITLPATLKKLWAIADQLVPEKRPGDFNQAMMELGATVCLPENPQCGQCAVQVYCTARAKQWQKKLPYKKLKETITRIQTATLVLKKKEKVLIQKQPPRARWGGLWMFPHWATYHHLKKTPGLKRSELKHILTVEHGFTRYQMRLGVYALSQSHANEPDNLALFLQKNSHQYRWVKASQLKQFAFPAPHQKIVQHLLAQ